MQTTKQWFQAMKMHSADSTSFRCCFCEGTLVAVDLGLHLPHLQLLFIKVAQPLKWHHFVEAIQEGSGLLLYAAGEPPVGQQAEGRNGNAKLLLAVRPPRHFSPLPDVLLLVVFCDQLVLAALFQLVGGNLAEDLHVLREKQLHSAFLQVVLSAHKHRKEFAFPTTDAPRQRTFFVSNKGCNSC